LTKPLTGKKALVTAGPTYEAIDPVRFIGNHSTGKMGLAIAKELERRGAEVTLVLGPSSIGASENEIRLIHVKSADEMFNACDKIFETADIAVMSAAVADYTPVTKASEKIKKKGNTFTIELMKTKDILENLGQRKKAGQVLVGFALETKNEKEYALDKLKRKNADWIVMNSLKDEGAGFGYDTNKVTIFGKNGEEIGFEKKTKTEVAKDIVDTIIRNHYA
jgi:phosphopantothenoylcysteine decarboxylase/phosphopantothenate--cysteine ligase